MEVINGRTASATVGAAVVGLVLSDGVAVGGVDRDIGYLLDQPALTRSDPDGPPEPAVMARRATGPRRDVPTGCVAAVPVHATADAVGSRFFGRRIEHLRVRLCAL
jgi:hypothetical protein